MGQGHQGSVPERKHRFLFKQWGGIQKKRHGRELDGRTWDEMPELVI
jgi:protein gp37